MFGSRISYLYHNYFPTREMGGLINLAEVIIKEQRKSAVSLALYLNICY